MAAVDGAAVEYRGIGRPSGDCLCETCVLIIVGQLRALLAGVPVERRAELLVAAVEEV
jgi:hypothetical protein